jgi:ribosomal-protein-alanine N-acetyltransferase
MEECPALMTARLRLRPMALADIDDLHRLWTVPGVRRYLWDDEVITRARAAEVVAASVASFARLGIGLWVVRDRASAEVIGFCGLRTWDDGDDVEVLYAIAPARWGAGLATEAVVAVLAHAFASTALERVYGFTDPPNTASARVMEKAGMRPDPAAAARRGLVAYVRTRAPGAGDE